MDETIKNALDKLFESLTDDQKKEAMKCKNMDEFLTLLEKEEIALPDELADVAGGYCGYWDDYMSFRAERRSDL